MRTEPDLLSQLVLGGMRVLKLAAETKRQPDPQRELKTHVELKLTPIQAEARATPGSFVVRARLNCVGRQPSDADEEVVFTIDCKLELVYRQVRGEQLDFDAFKAGHTQFNRQIYPLLIQQVQPLLAQLGLHQVRLPIDMLQIRPSVAEQPDQLH